MDPCMCSPCPYGQLCVSMGSSFFLSFIYRV